MTQPCSAYASAQLVRLAEERPTQRTAQRHRGAAALPRGGHDSHGEGPSSRPCLPPHPNSPCKVTTAATDTPSPASPHGVTRAGEQDATVAATYQIVPACEVHYDVVATSIAAYPDSTSLCRATQQEEGQRRVTVCGAVPSLTRPAPTTTTMQQQVASVGRGVLQAARPTQTSATTRPGVPVYGPSIMPRHVQFVNVVTKCGSLTPFDLEEAHVSRAGCAQTPGSVGDEPETPAEQGRADAEETNERRSTMTVVARTTEETTPASAPQHQNNNNAIKTPSHATVCAEEGLPSPSPRPHLDGTPYRQVTTKLYQLPQPQFTSGSRATTSSSQLGMTASVKRSSTRSSPSTAVLGGGPHIAVCAGTTPRTQDDAEVSVESGGTNLAQTMQHLVRQLEARRAQQAPSQRPAPPAAATPGAMTERPDASRSLQACLADSAAAGREEGERTTATDACGDGATGASFLSAPPVQTRYYTVWLEGHLRRRVEASSSVPWSLYSYVLYDADRGVDMGRVVSCVVRCCGYDERMNVEAEEAAMAGSDEATPRPLRRRGGPFILREATAEERHRWLREQVAAAREALEPCREAVAKLQLPLRIVAAVYQFNMKKITFFYESDVRVDFRQLLQSLFSQFHCRIWMERFQPSFTLDEGAMERRG